MAGPSLALFMPQAEEEADAPRARKLPMEDNEGKPSDEEQPAKDKPKPLLPISHEVVLESHEKSIQALTIDREGTRMITGGLDYRMKVWDFTTMNRNLKPYKDFKPFDGHPIRALSFNPSSSHFLCCCHRTSCLALVIFGPFCLSNSHGLWRSDEAAGTASHADRAPDVLAPRVECRP